ncbi:chromate transporter [Aeromicrobium ponti]
MIPLLEKAVTKKNRWVKKEDISDVLVVAQTVPGSIAVNTATFVGYQVAGIPGALAATLGIITPTFVIILIFATLFLNFQHNPIIQAAFVGIRPAIVALILYAAYKIGLTAMIDKLTTIIALISLMLFLFLPVHPIIILIFGGVTGVLLSFRRSVHKTKTYSHSKGSSVTGD